MGFRRIPLDLSDVRGWVPPDSLQEALQGACLGAGEIY